MSHDVDRAAVRRRAEELVGPGINRRVALIVAYAELAGDRLDPEAFDDAAVILRAERLLLDGLPLPASIGAAVDEYIGHCFDCLDCDVDTVAIGEYYMLRDEVWAEAAEPEAGMLCIGCVEKRIGRRLEPDDITWVSERSSERLRSRIRGAA